jgi:hypothetical protein
MMNMLLLTPSIPDRCNRQGKLTATLNCGPGTRQQVWQTAGQQRGLYYCILQQGGYRSPALKILLID